MVSLEAHEYEERRGEDEHERAEREPQRDATDRSGIGAQLLEDELAAWAIETEARSDTEAARATGGAALTLTPTLTLTRHRAEAALSTAAPAGRERDAPERRVVHGLKQVVQRLVQAARHEELAQQAGRQVDRDHRKVRQSRESLWCPADMRYVRRARGWHAYGTSTSIVSPPGRAALRLRHSMATRQRRRAPVRKHRRRARARQAAAPRAAAGGPPCALTPRRAPRA